MLRNRLRLSFLLACVALVTGAGAQSSSGAGSTAVDYVLQPLDLLQMRVYQEPSMDREVRISRENAVMLPLIGRVDLAGRTVREAEQLITELYNRDYLVNPQINITVIEYARRTVNVLGSVTTPGEVQFPREEGLTLLDAISRAGGFTRLADRRRIKLTRTQGDGTTATFVVNADDIIQGSSSQTWKLQTNDIIFVPERIL